MATVKFSQDLKHALRQNVCAPFDNRLIEASKVSIPDSQFIYDKFIVTPEQQKMLEALPNDWIRLSKDKDVSILISYTNGGIPDNPKSYAAVLSLKFSKEVPWSNKGWLRNSPEIAWKKEYFSFGNNRIGAVIAVEEWEAIREHLERDYMADTLKIAAERDKLLTGIFDIVDKTTTLNQAARIWPGILKYTPTEVLDRYHKKQTRQSASELEISEDSISSLNIAHIRHQMTV